MTHVILVFIYRSKGKRTYSFPFVLYMSYYVIPLVQLSHLAVFPIFNITAVS